MKKFILSLSFMLFAASAMAQEAPVPRNAPRTPVQRQDAQVKKPAAPVSREIQGIPTIFDAERLRINQVDMRLFGIVPPQLSASYGPQARAALDSIVAGQNVNCTIRDRDRDGRYLATCRSAANADLALELLRRGLAVAARGSLSGASDVAIAYLTAEQEAQTQKAGLWSNTTPAPVLTTQAPIKPPEPVIAPAPTVPTTPPPFDIKVTTDTKPVPKPETVGDDVQAKVASVTVPPKATLEDQAEAFARSNLFARYQILIAGFLMLATALGIFGILSAQRVLERRDERKAIGAALRGELMAARAVCQTRLKALSEGDEKNVPWPRIRTTLYQAYVGRLGWLGAELARQVASIYGQASDYAVYYKEDGPRMETAPKRQALQTLIQYIDQVLPKLTYIEKTGRVDLDPGTPAGFAAKASAVVFMLWATMQKFSREHWAEKPQDTHTAEAEAADADYAALIEAEIESLSFTENSETEGDKTAPDNVTKFRGMSS